MSDLETANFYRKQLEKAEAENSRLQAQLAQLREALQRYGVHKGVCLSNAVTPHVHTKHGSWFAVRETGIHCDKRHECDCGLTALTSTDSQDWLSTKLREAKAEALREAADFFQQRADNLTCDGGRSENKWTTLLYAASQLRARADSIVADTKVTP